MKPSIRKSTLRRVINEEIRRMLSESPASDAHEKAVADAINAVKGVKAERPKVSAGFADVLVKLDSGPTSWLEVKMNHSDNLSNPRVFFDGSKWDTTYTTPTAKFAVELLNKSAETKKFIAAIRKFWEQQDGKTHRKIVLPTTLSGLKDPNAVPLKVMKAYFDQPGINRYIAHEPNVNLGKLVTDHYLKGKNEPAHYMQAADDFYMIGGKNPLGLPADVPKLTGKGTFKVRISTRSAFYEIQAEVKIDSMPSSKYSALKGSKKVNPFSKLKA